MIVWCAELGLVVATGPAALRYLAARRARRDFPIATAVESRTR